MRIYFQIKCWRAVGVVSTVATLTVSGEALRVPMPPLPPGAEKFVATHQVEASPVDNFRYWLKLSPEERKKQLAILPEPARKALEAKLSAYDGLSDEARDLRLRQTQLHWQLLELMKLPAGQRQSRLAQVPANQRALVTERLKQWDALKPAEQKEFLDNEATVGLYLQLQETRQPRLVLQSLPPQERKVMEQKLQKWNGLPAPQRQDLSDRFNRFFQLEEQERAKIVASLPANIRQQVEKMTEALKQLPPDQRQRCTEALNKFLKMTPEQQNQFLANASRWQRMSEKEHNAWRQVVNQAPAMPPLPPVLRMPPSPAIVGSNNVVPANLP